MSNQAPRVYAAERRAWKRCHQRQRPLADLQRSANRVVESRWWLERFPAVQSIRIRALTDKYQGAKCTPRGAIYCDERHRTEFVLAHELAHLASQDFADPDDDDHKGEFARAYLSLTFFLLGAEAARALRTEFQHERITVAPSKRSMHGDLEAA